MLDVVTTTGGRIRGHRAAAPHERVTRFRGIPYAAPPVGPLRWTPPARPEPWQGVRDCVSDGPGALQQFHGDWQRRDGYVPGYYDRTPPMSEDCLYLSVATPAEGAGEDLPVYVWFHGGGLTNGFANEAPTDPSYLADQGIVVVSVAHRVNTFGYLTLPQLRDEQGTSGNYGLLDLLAAMEWVYANIAEFGGDPTNTTVGGISGGTQKACAIVATPHGVGHVRHVINQSGLKWKQPLFEQGWAEEHGQRMLELLGIDPQASLDELRRVDADAFLRSVPRDALPDYMVTDDVLPFDDLAGGIARYGLDVDYLNGMAFGEADVFATASSAPGVPVAGADSPFRNTGEFDAHFGALLGDLGPAGGLAAPLGVTDDDAWHTARVLASRGLTGDERTNVSRNLMLNRLFGGYVRRSGGTGRVFDYLWSHRPPTAPHDRGTPRDPALGLNWHGGDLWYQFGTTTAEIAPERPWTDLDRALTAAVTGYVVSFIRTGDPNTAGLPRWPESADDRGWLDIGDTITAHTGDQDDLDPLIRRFVEREYRLDTSAD